MAAAENSDVVSLHDGVSPNASYDLYRRCLRLWSGIWLITLHISHFAFGFYICPVLSHLLSISQVYVLVIKIISACWKEHRQKRAIEFHSDWSCWSLWNDSIGSKESNKTEIVKLLIWRRRRRETIWSKCLFAVETWRGSSQMLL